MNWGFGLTGMFCRACLTVLGSLVLAACQPSLKSELPAGPSAYDAIQRPQAPDGPYLLRPGDKIAVNVFQEEDLTQPELQIDEAGMISLPLIGEVQAAGLTSTQLARTIEQGYGNRFLRTPQANVVLLAARPRTVSVEGEVTRPGVFQIERGQTLLTAIALAGSPTETARLDEVLVFRTINGERFGGRFDLTEIRSGRSDDPQILPGDVVVVGFSSLRGLYRDILQAAPLFGAFVSLSTNSSN